MSVKIMGAVWDSALPKSEKFIALAYADHASHDGANIYPSIGLIAWKTGYSNRAVQRITQSLIVNKILVHVGKHGKYQTNMYEMNVQKLPKRDDMGGGDTVTGGVTSTTQGGDIHDTGGDIHDENMSQMSPYPLEPSVNHQEPLYIAKHTRPQNNGRGFSFDTVDQRAYDQQAKIQEIAAAIETVVKETFAPGVNDEKLGSTAKALIEKGVTPEQVYGFTEWWARNSHYKDKTAKPVLKSLLNKWSDYISQTDTSPDQAQKHIQGLF